MLWLERKFLSMVASNLQMSKWKNENTLNHRCPYCGDSTKNEYKSRGYHFVIEQSFVYKCHNCGKSTSSINFIKDHFPVIHKEYLKEWLQEKGQKPKQVLPSANKFKFKKREVEDKLSLENLKAMCVPANERIVAKEYLEKRQIPQEKWRDLWYCETPQSLSFLSSKYRERVLGTDPRLILPFVKDGELVGITGRALNDSPLRYLTMRFRDDIPLIFNIDNVDKSKTILVTEGPIDSLFLPNSIAVAGSDFKKIDNSIIPNAVLIYDNEPRNTEIIKKIEEVIDLGYRVVIWNTKKVQGLKDINDMVNSGLTIEEIVDIIDAHTYEGLTARMKLKEFRKT